MKVRLGCLNTFKIALTFNFKADTLMKGWNSCVCSFTIILIMQMFIVSAAKKA